MRQDREVGEKMVLRHLVYKNLINRILKNLDPLWQRTPKERRPSISSSCTQDDGEPKIWISVIFRARRCHF